jgi:predicted nucleotide-binding protein (sugar kinase/HSP70/actin superfamily)
MKATFPYMGNIYIPLKTLLKELNIEPVIPPPPNKETLSLGTKYSPELMCLPFKLTLGNLIKALEMGADTIIHCSGFWSCRYGHYPYLHADILRNLGYKFFHIILRKEELKNVYIILKNLFKKDTILLEKITKAVMKTYFKSTVMEALERKAMAVRPLEKRKGQTTKVLNKYLKKLFRTENIFQMKKIKKLGIRNLENLIDEEKRKSFVPKIKIVGEAFCLVEPYVNFNIVEKLGEMGFYADPFLTAHSWLGFHSIRLGNNLYKKIKNLAKEYWRYNVGGEDMNTIGHTLLAIKEGYSGVIHLHPFGCLPQTMTQGILEKISEKYSIPLLDISLDEHTSENIMENRLSAFLEIIKRKIKIWQ